MCIRDSLTAAANVFLGRELTRRIGPIRINDYAAMNRRAAEPVSYTHLRAHETVLDLVCRLLLEKKKNQRTNTTISLQTRHLVHVHR